MSPGTDQSTFPRPTRTPGEPTKEQTVVRGRLSSWPLAHGWETGAKGQLPERGWRAGAHEREKKGSILELRGVES